MSTLFLVQIILLNTSFPCSLCANPFRLQALLGMSEDQASHDAKLAAARLNVLKVLGGTHHPSSPPLSPTPTPRASTTTTGSEVGQVDGERQQYASGAMKALHEHKGPLPSPTQKSKSPRHSPDIRFNRSL